MSMCWSICASACSSRTTISSLATAQTVQAAPPLVSALSTHVYEVCHRGVDLQQEVVLPNVCRQAGRTCARHGQRQTLDGTSSGAHSIAEIPANRRYNHPPACHPCSPLVLKCTPPMTRSGFCASQALAASKSAKLSTLSADITRPGLRALMAGTIRSCRGGAGKHGWAGKGDKCADARAAGKGGQASERVRRQSLHAPAVRQLFSQRQGVCACASSH